ncbi:MAG: PQQ-binding-like beta-propeller repeat protein [Planctomyces sp.]
MKSVAVLRVFRIGVFSLCAAALSGLVIAGDWPSWRGPNRDDISTETGLLKSWPEGGPQKIWETREAGLGYSGFAIVGNRLYTMGSDGKEQTSGDFLIAMDVETGKKVWELKVGQYLENGWGGGPRSTPTVSADGKYVVAIGAQGDVVCATTADGKEAWRVAMKQTDVDDPKNLGGSVPSWGYCESALIDGDKVLCTPGGSLGTVACFKLDTGEKLWQSAEMTETAHYSSIIVVSHFGKKQYIQLTSSKLFGLDENGKLQWQANFNGRVAVIPTPIYRDGSVYVTAGYGAGCMLVKVSADNQVTEVYKNNEMKNHHGGVVLVGDHLYGHSDSVGIICQKFDSGEQVWTDKKRDGSKGAVAFADGMLYCLSENSGECFLVSATPEGYTEHGRFTLSPQTEQRNPQGRVWTHPVICNGRLYLRDQEIICCYDIKQP